MKLERLIKVTVAPRTAGAALEELIDFLRREFPAGSVSDGTVLEVELDTAAVHEEQIEALLDTIPAREPVPVPVKGGTYDVTESQALAILRSTFPGCEVQLPRNVGFRSEELRSWRGRQGLTRPELGELIGVTGSAIASWELDRWSPKYVYIARLSALMSVQPLSLVRLP